MPAMVNAYALIVGIARRAHVAGLPEAVHNDARQVRDLLADPRSLSVASARHRQLGQNVTPDGLPRCGVVVVRVLPDAATDQFLVP